MLWGKDPTRATTLCGRDPEFNKANDYIQSDEETECIMGSLQQHNYEAI